ncbi:UNVERIFIED_ORG: hypothetical protein J2Y77_004206 [Pseudomonas lini]|uniref:hypothetical protein n=1 Tax=Pseudomonas viciae TaxID=2505979 RepID=UPI0015AE515B|nr:hypothetical protein [Pseudomonas viciae]UZE85916.1 hypothetical protein LOY66_25815 [Pseudomonas viciae]
MKRKRPPRLVDSPFPTDTAASASWHPPTWDCSSDVPRPGYLGTMLYAVAVLLALPVYGLAVLSMKLFHVGQSLSPIHTRVIEDPLFLTLMFISTFVAVCILKWLACAPEVLGFCFDERQQRLTFTQRRRARQSTEECVPYSDIHSIRPYITTASANVCHFEVCFAGANGKPIALRFGDVTVRDMAFHAAWLRQSIGERMQEVLDLDL